MKKLFCSAAIMAALMASGCTTDPYTGEQKISKAAIGSLAGAAVGAAAAKKKDRAKGAVIGAALGGGAGFYFDNQERKLREKLQGTGVSVTRTEAGITLNMPGNISFPSGQYSILPGFYDTLNSVALVLKEFDKTAVKVSGHTDSTGGFELNQRLSENRAQAVSDYLASQGVSRSRLQSVGYGPRYPIADNNTAAGKAANRRVTIEIVNP